MSKTAYITSRYIAALAAMTLALIPAAAKKNTTHLADRESSGFNALDHVLQKPLGNPSFPQDDRGFGRHIFLGISAGGSVIGNDFSGGIKPGAQLGGQIGGWITPVHGVRLGADIGLHSLHQGAKRTWFGAARAEYLMNLSALLRGYDPSRRFELIGSVGLEYQRLRQNEIWGNGYGVGAALQMRFNVAPSLFLYVEPRLTMLGGMRYDTGYNWRRLHADLSLNLGLGYRILTGRMRRAGATDFTQTGEDNLYIGAGGGLMIFPRGSVSYKNPLGSVHIGKMLSSASGIQLSLTAGQDRTGYGTDNKIVGIGSLDYVLNLNSAFGGYRPDEVFQMTLNAGVSGAMVRRGKNDKITPGAGVGLTGLFRLSPNWGIFIHPQVYAFGGNFSEALGRGRSVLVTADLGLRYTIGDFSRLHPASFDLYNEDTRHWFITGGVGGAARLRAGYGPGGDLFVGFGKRFSPISSWRVGLRGETFPRKPQPIAGTIHADYLSSITTAMMGYDEERLFDLQAVVGVFAGAANYDNSITGTFGLTGGLQANFRLSRWLDLYVEPQLEISNVPGSYGSHIWMPEARVMLGLRYKLGTPAGGRGHISDTPYSDRRNFASVTLAPTYFTGATSGKELSAAFDLSVGRWFSMISGLRGVYASDFIHRGGKTHYMGSLHLDYLLNFTSLLDRSAGRRFHIIGAAGGGIAFSGTANTSPGPMAYGGVQFRYNLPFNVDIHMEPGAQLWTNREIPEASSPHRFEISARMAVGASFRF